MYIIHTVGPVYKEGDPKCEKLLCKCYYNSLELAKQHDIHSIAFPAISTGVYGYPAEEAAAVALRAVSEWLSENDDYGMAVIMSCFSERMYETYQKMIRSLHIRNISFPPKDYSQINPKEILAFSLAEGGAMGSLNEVIFVRRKEGFVEFLYSYVNDKLGTLVPWLDELDCGLFRNVSDVGSGWKHVDLGMGNHLFLTDDVHEHVNPKFEGKRPPEIYQSWRDAVTESLLSEKRAD